MKARNAPEIARPDIQASALEQTLSVTRHEPPVKRSELMTKRTRKPSQKAAKKPPKSPGFFWRKNGAGWDLRRDIYVTSNEGIRKRKQPYVSHMSQEAFRELKRQNKGAALERAIAEWIADHDK